MNEVTKLLNIFQQRQQVSMASSNFDYNEYDLSTTSPLQLQECWTCRCCGRINSITITMSTPRLLCTYCHKGRYIPGETKIIAHRHSKYSYKIANKFEKRLLRDGMIKRIKVWKCNYCHCENGMFFLECCSCNRTRATNPTWYYKNEMAKWICYRCGTQILGDKCPNCFADINPLKFDWQCRNCQNVHPKIKKGKKINKCNVCGFIKPLSFNWKTYKHSMDALIDGYCKECLYIPVYLIDIIKKYYIIIIPKDQLKKKTITDRENGVYIWHYQIKQTENNKNKTVKVAIGLKEVNHQNIYNKRYMLNNKSREKKKYCQEIVKDDIVTMELNYLKGTLSFGINNDWFGIFLKINNKKKYIPQLYCRGAKIELIKMKIIHRNNVETQHHMNNICGNMVKEVSLSNDDTVKDQTIMTLLKKLEELHD